MAKKCKIWVDSARSPLAEQIVDLQLECDPVFLPWIENMLNSVYNLLECNVIEPKRAEQYLLDIAGDRLRTHLAVWNPQRKIKIKYT